MMETIDFVLDLAIIAMLGYYIWNEWNKDSTS